jgi:peptidoglycan/LPS O-acetylase OafA/YrhL
VSRQLGSVALFLAAALAAFGIAAAVNLADGSSSVAWFVTTVGAGLALVAIAEALGLEEWIQRASPTARLAYLVVSFVALGAAVGAYFIWQTVALWWLAPLAAWPLYWLLIYDRDRRPTNDRDRRPAGADGGFEGPLTPPDGGNGGV